MKHRFPGLAALAAATLLIAACSSTSTDGSTPAEPGKPIHLAVVHGVTGAFASFAKDFLTGANAAADTINAKGGVNGRPIQIQVLDDQSDATKAVSVLTGAIESDTPPDAVVLGGGSGETLAVLPQTTDDKLLTVTNATSPQANDPKAYPYNFGVSALQVDGLTSVGEDLKTKKVTKLGVILPANAFGDAVLGGIQAQAQKAGATIVATERPDPAALDFTVQVQRIQAAKPDAIFFDFPSQDAIARLLTARATLAATDIPIYGGSGASGTVISGVVDKAAVANCTLPAYKFTIEGAGGTYLQPFYAALASAKSAYTSGLGWDAVYVAALAFERAGNDPTGDSLAAALTSTPIPADYLAVYSTGTAYSSTSHYPTVNTGSLSLVPCASTVSNGLWVTK